MFRFQILIILVLLVVPSSIVFASGSKMEHFTLPENRGKKLPFSDAVLVNDTVYLSGQIGIPPGKKSLVAGGIEPETTQVMENIRLVLKHFHLSFDNLVRCQVMLADISEWPAFNTVYTKYFNVPYPARSALASSGLAFGARLELECIATTIKISK